MSKYIGVSDREQRSGCQRVGCVVNRRWLYGCQRIGWIIEGGM